MTPVANSHSILIRENILTRLKALPFFPPASWTFRRSRALQIQLENIPYLGCYIVDEVMTPDGDANAGPPEFVHALRIAMPVVIQNNDPDATEEKLDAAYWAILNGLLRDQTLMLSQDARIESFSRVSRSHVYGNASADNETPVGELRLEFTIIYRSYWNPIVTDDLETIHVETAYPSIAEKDNVQQVILDYDIPQN